MPGVTKPLAPHVTESRLIVQRPRSISCPSLSELEPQFMDIIVVFWLMIVRRLLPLGMAHPAKRYMLC
jgi:hypothetical protein